MFVTKNSIHVVQICLKLQEWSALLPNWNDQDQALLVGPFTKQELTTFELGSNLIYLTLSFTKRFDIL